jgi:hypothetical protein
MRNSIPGIGRIEKEVAVFRVWLDHTIFPFPFMRIKIYRIRRGEYQASPNVLRKDRETGEPNYICGIGNSVETAMSDFFKYYLDDIRQNSVNGQLSEDDFDWSAPEDF